MLLKIGKRFINLDNVTAVYEGYDVEGKDALKVWFNGSEDDVLYFRGTEQEAILSYLDTMAVDVLAVYAEKNKPDCATCGDTGVTAIRNGDDDTPCPDCAKPNDHREIPY